MLDVVIVGAGLAGLSAARELLSCNPSLKIAILEARARVGGRLCSEVTTHGALVDTGGAYVGPTQDFILSLAQDLGVETFKIHNRGKTAWLSTHGNVSHASPERPPGSVLELLDFAHALQRFDKASAVLDPEAPWAHKNAAALDAMSATDWAQHEAATRRVQYEMGAIAEGAFCKPPSEVSALAWLWGMKAAGNIAHAMGIENAAQERKFVGGAAQIPEKMAAALPEGTLLFEHVVTSIEQQHQEHVVVTCANGAALSAKRAISAVPLPLLRGVRFSPPLDDSKRALLDGCSMGSIIKVIVFYEHAFWRAKGLSGQLVDTGFGSSSSDAGDFGPLQSTMDDTKPDGSFPAIIGFILSTQARTWAERSANERRTAVLQQLSRAFGEEALTPAAYVEKDWNKEAFSGGCYVGSFARGVTAAHGAALRVSHGLVHFCGTETATRHAGYMNGAVQSGLRAAKEALAGLNGLDEVERVVAPKAVLPHKSNAPGAMERAAAAFFGLFVKPFLG